MSRLRVGLVAPPWVAVPPPRYGGTELIIDHLARGLVAEGHRVVLFTTGDATAAVPRRWVYPRALGTIAATLPELHQVQRGYESLTGQVDIIHDHTVLGPVWALADGVPTPVVATNHAPFGPELTSLYARIGRRVPVVAISLAQRASAPGVPVRAVIHHGIEVERFPVGAGDGGYVVFLGRMDPDKGPHRAIRAARDAGVRVVLAAKMWDAAERRFFADEVAPLLGPDAEYVGEIGGADKARLLGGAAALLNPISWSEPFGLVMVEALACGTPVISYRAGSAPEIVTDGITGFLCDDEQGMSAAITAVGSLDRRRCRADAEARFTVRRMVRDHVRLYREVLAGAAGGAEVIPLGPRRTGSTLAEPG